MALLDDPSNSHFIAWTGRGMEFKLIEPEEVSRSAPHPQREVPVETHLWVKGQKQMQKKHKFEISGSVNPAVGQKQRRFPPDPHGSLLFLRFSLVSTRCHRSSSSLTDRIQDLGRFSRRNFRLNSHRILIIRIFSFFLSFWNLL